MGLTWNMIPRFGFIFGKTELIEMYPNITWLYIHPTFAEFPQKIMGYDDVILVYFSLFFKDLMLV